MKCPCCEQEIPEQETILFSDEWRTVMHAGDITVLSPLEYKILRAIERRARTCFDLIEVMYSDRADGGPENPRVVVQCTKNTLNKKLKPLKLFVGTDRRGPHAPIRLVRL